MTIEDFKTYVKTRKPLDTEEIHRFMDEMSNEARRVTFRLNTAYHTPDEVRGLLSKLFGYEVPQSLRVFHPSMRISVKHHRRRKCVYQRLLSFSRPRWSHDRRRMPDRS